jgi:hypothetical protein
MANSKIKKIQTWEKGKGEEKESTIKEYKPEGCDIRVLILKYNINIF